MIQCAMCNPAVDVVYTLDELKPGTTAVDIPSSIYPAGKGINVAKVVKALGEDTRVLALIPDNDRVRFSTYLDLLEIDYAFYPVAGSARINTTFAEKEIRQATHINSVGTSYPPRVQDEFIAFVQSHLEKGDRWVFTGSLPRGFTPDTYARLIRAVREKQIFCLLDSRGEALRQGVRAFPTMVKPNLSELEEFFGEHIQGVHHIALKGKRLLDLGIEYVFISLGADGMIAIHQNECLLCCGPSIEPVDTVGGGDAMVAGLLVAHGRGFSFSETCRLAIACGAGNALHRGPGVIQRDEVWRLMENVRVEAV
ncbi:MAG: 1-phosphofructokinase family hexose kinase [Chitinispirillaceae bacterium]